MHHLRTRYFIVHDQRNNWFETLVTSFCCCCCLQPTPCVEYTRPTEQLTIFVSILLNCACLTGLKTWILCATEQIHRIFFLFFFHATTWFCCVVLDLVAPKNVFRYQRYWTILLSSLNGNVKFMNDHRRVSHIVCYYCTAAKFY